MAYSETRIIIGGLAHVPVLIFIANFFKGKFGIKTEDLKETLVKETPVKVNKAKETIVKQENVTAIKELENKLDNIEEKEAVVYEKVKKNMKRD